MEKSYTPINCSYYDRLEAWATRGQVVSIRFRESDTGPEKEVEAVITDLQTREGVEYMSLSNGSTLRLDQLIAVDGHPVILAC